MRHTEKVAAVYGLFMVLDAGGVVDHQAITAAIGLRPDQAKYRSIVREAAKRLERLEGRAVRPVNEIGYQRLTDDEMVTWLPAHRRGKASRQMRRVRKALRALPVGNLTLHQQAMRAFEIDAIGRSIREMQQAQKAADSLPGPYRGQPLADAAPADS